MAMGQKGRLQLQAPILPSSPSSCSSSPTKNHFKDHNIYHELYYGILFFMFKNKRWLRELYLVYGSRLHVNVLIGQLLYLRCRVSPSSRGFREWDATGTPQSALLRTVGLCVAFSLVESVVLSPGTIAKQDNSYLKIHRKCFLSQCHNCYDSEK